MTAQQYRKKPVTVEAMGPLTPENRDEIAAWCGGKAEERMVPGPGRGLVKSVLIHTMEGTMRAGDGWYVIRGVKGEFYPCRGDIFEQTYEAVEEDR